MKRQKQPSLSPERQKEIAERDAMIAYFARCGVTQWPMSILQARKLCQRIERLEAEAGARRAALSEFFADIDRFGKEWERPTVTALRAALSGTAGEAITERLAKLEAFARQVLQVTRDCPGWGEPARCELDKKASEALGIEGKGDSDGVATQGH